MDVVPTRPTATLCMPGFPPRRVCVAERRVLPYLTLPPTRRVKAGRESNGESAYPTVTFDLVEVVHGRDGPCRAFRSVSVQGYL